MTRLPFEKKRVLVTGATAGIGAATADAFCAQGAEVVAVGRREDRLHDLAEEWADHHAAHVLPVALDVRDRDAVVSLAKDHPKLFDVDVVVNNAGLAKGLDSMQTGDYEDWKTMVDTNVLGLLSVTRECLPALQERRGHVVNLGSVAGRWVYPGGGVYAATKFAVRALSEGLRYDLAGTGVRVTNIEPGLVETEFSDVRFDGDTERARKVYQGYEPLRPADVADAIVWSCSRPGHVNVQELVLYPTAQAGVTAVHKDG